MTASSLVNKELDSQDLHFVWPLEVPERHSIYLNLYIEIEVALQVNDKLFNKVNGPSELTITKVTRNGSNWAFAFQSPTRYGPQCVSNKLRLRLFIR